MPTQKKRGPGQPKKEPTKVVSFRITVKDYKQYVKQEGVTPEAAAKQSILSKLRKIL